MARNPLATMMSQAVSPGAVPAPGGARIPPVKTGPKPPPPQVRQIGKAPPPPAPRNQGNSGTSAAMATPAPNNKVIGRTPNPSPVPMVPGQPTRQAQSAIPGAVKRPIPPQFLRGKKGQ